jgi:hypothetical protein
MMMDLRLKVTDKPEHIENDSPSEDQILRVEDSAAESQPRANSVLQIDDSELPQSLKEAFPESIEG